MEAGKEGEVEGEEEVNELKWIEERAWMVSVFDCALRNRKLAQVPTNWEQYLVGAF